MSCTQPIRNENDLNKFRNYYRTIEDKPRNYALIEFGLNSALRISDILALHWNDVYLTSTHKYRDHILVKEQKTGKENVIILNKNAQNALEKYRKTLSDFNAANYIFRSQKQPELAISRCQAFRIIKKAAQACGLEQHVSNKCMIISTKKIFFLYVLKNCVHLYLISLNYFDFDLISYIY